MCRKQAFAYIFCVLLLASCDIHSEVTDLRDGDYMLTETDTKVGVGGVKASVVSSVYQRAEAFCTSMNGKLRKISDDTESASMGKFAFYTLRFRCD